MASGHSAISAQSRTISCRPCRERKVRCDRLIPCKSCIQHDREEECCDNPSFVVPSKRKIPISRTVTSPLGVLQRLPKVTVSTQQQYYTPPESVHDEDEALPSTETISHKTVESLQLFTHSESLRRTHSSLNWPGNGPTKYSKSYSSSQSMPNLQVNTFASIPAINTSIGLNESQWKVNLIHILPTRTQCDFLVSYFFENIYYIYQHIHAPSFREEYAQFWKTPVHAVDPIWLSLLYIILCSSGSYIGVDIAETLGFKGTEIRKLSHLWYSASRQCLHAGNYESKPCFRQLQTFILCQLYWYATKNVETLNSCLGQALRNAQAIGLDKDTAEATNLETEMRHRLWWDLCCSDTFQALTLNRQPFIQAHLSKVPFPQNCDDIDLTETSICIRPIEEPTVNSMNIWRSKVFKTFDKLYSNNGAFLSDFEFIKGIDAEILADYDDLPWYFRINAEGECANLPPAFEYIHWQNHVIHSCISIQRIRMYRPFLISHITPSWNACVSAAESSLLVYKHIRNQSLPAFKKAQKFLPHTYQIFATAVILATFLLVEQRVDPRLFRIREDVEMVITDLQRLDNQDYAIPMAVDGIKVLKKILAIYDSRGKGEKRGEREQLIPEIYSVMGGKNTAKTYLERCAIEYIVNETPLDTKAPKFKGQEKLPAETETNPGTDWSGGYAYSSGWDFALGNANGEMGGDFPFENISWDVGDILLPFDGMFDQFYTGQGLDGMGS